MRYQKIQFIKTTVCDEEISDIDVLRSLISQLVDADVDVLIEFRNPQTDTPQQHERARIESFENDVVHVRIYFSSSILRKNIELKNLTLVRLVTEQHTIIVGKDQENRFDLIDIGS